jgi:C4-type Zn-finger protein
MVTMFSLVHGILNGFGTAVKNLEDSEHSGRPTAVRTPDMIETVREFISTDRRMTLRIMEEEVLCGLVE